MGLIKIGGMELKWGRNQNNGLTQGPDPAYDANLDRVAKLISEAILPVAAGRQTLPDNKSLLAVFGDMLITNPEFELKWLEVIEQLAMWDGDMSAAIENIGLANTKLITTFPDSVPDSMQQEALAFLRESRDKWYNYSDGINGWIDDSLVQAAIYGCLSHEILPTTNFDSVADVIMVNPKNILFRYDVDQKRYIPIQKIPQTLIYTGAAYLGEYKKLNTVTYRYLAMRRIGESPYAVPPFLSSLESIRIKKTMLANMDTIISNLGLLGFLKVMMTAPAKMQSESESGYQARLTKSVYDNAANIKSGAANGFMVGYKNIHEIEMQKVDQNTDGAEKLMDINDTHTIQGLKQHREMMNRKGTTSETFGRVILAKLGKQLEKYQTITGTAMNYMDIMHLQLAGYPIERISNTFEKVMLGDVEREENAKSKRIDNAIKMYNAGWVDQTKAANMGAGIDKPDMEAPRIVQVPIGVDNPEDSKAPGNPSADQNPSDGKTTEKQSKVSVELPQQWRKVLVDTPEEGMGFHLVDITTPMGIYENVVVTNCTYAWFNNTAITTNLIQSVGVKKKDQLVEYYSRLMGGHLREFYGNNTHGHDHGHDLASFGLPEEEEEMWEAYYASISKQWKKTTDIITSSISKMLDSWDGLRLDHLQNMVYYHVLSKVQNEFRPMIKPIVQDHVQDIYDYYRRSKKPWEAVAKGKKDIPDAVFNLTDVRSIQFYQNSDNLYLGKFVTDQDTKKKVVEYVKKWYLDNDREIGNSAKALRQFQDEFPGVLDGESWKIRRVIDTTVNRMRNTGAISYMQQAGVKSFRVVGISDKRQCSYCAALNGKVMVVDYEMEKITRIASSAPESLPDISPFVTSLDLTPQDYREIAGSEIQKLGVGMPGYHPLCRCVVVVDFT